MTQLTVCGCSLPELPFKTTVEGECETLKESREQSKWSQLELLSLFMVRTRIWSFKPYVSKKILRGHFVLVLHVA
jgi:hypothetical protein